MSEVDRLSHSGLYPALPIADQRRDQDGSARKPPPQPRAGEPEAPADPSHPGPQRPPKSLIDEYA
jgi:hypothetical protein